MRPTRYTDGYIFGIIRNGAGLMPTYNRIEEPDRWDIVNYVRSLQGKGTIAADTTHGRPGETGAYVPGASRMGPTRPSPYYHPVLRAPRPQRRRPIRRRSRRLTRRRSRSTSREPSSRARSDAERSARGVEPRDSEVAEDDARWRCSGSARSIFIVGLFLDPDRAWRAFHANWLFFAALSQRRRHVRRGAAHHDGALVARRDPLHGRRTSPSCRSRSSFCCSRCRSAAATSSGGRTRRIRTPRRRRTSTRAFLTIRDIGIFALMTVLSIWYIYTSLRLDVGRLPEWGAKWAAGLRARMRDGFGDERREIHSTHSLQGKLAVFMVVAVRASAGRCSRGICRWVCSAHFQSTLYSWWFFMGGWLCALMLFSMLVRVVELVPRTAPTG